MRLMALIACLLVAAPVFAEEGYVCVADLGTGFGFDDTTKTWRVVKFQADNLKWRIKRRDNTVQDNLLVAPNDTWIVVHPNKTHLISMGCQESGDNKNLICGGIAGSSLKVNKHNLRLLFVYEFGYWTDEVGGSDKMAEGKGTPMIAIGRCRTL